jgi:branched-chain amino acid transport system substrate-binding protein
MRLHLILFFFVISLLGASSRSFGEGKHLKVAAVLGLTGDAAYHSGAIRKGIELAAEDLRALGWEIDLRFEDDQTNSTKTIAAMQFLRSNGYKLLIGPTWSFQVNAARQIIAKSDLVTLVPASSSEVNGGATEGIFNLCPVRTKQEPYVEDWLKTKPYRSAYIITPNEEWGEIHRKVFSQAIRAVGGQVAEEQQYDYGIDSSSLRVMLLKAKQTKADILFTTGPAGDVANIVRARNALKLDLAILSTSDIRDALALKLLSPQDVEREVYEIGLSAVASDFRTRFEARFGEAPNMYSDRGYDSLMVMAQATEHTDGSSNSIRKYLSSDFNYKGVSGPISFDVNGDIQEGRYQIARLSK